MAIRWMIQGMIACFAHNLRVSILNSSHLVEMLPAFCLALALEDIAIHPATILCFQPPRDKFIIHHVGPENVVLLSRKPNALEDFRGRGGKRCPNEGEIGRRGRGLAV